MEEIYNLVGKRIREERKKLNITQEHLAESTNLSSAFIGQIERGHIREFLDTRTWIDKYILVFNRMVEHCPELA